MGKTIFLIVCHIPVVVCVLIESKITLIIAAIIFILITGGIFNICAFLYCFIYMSILSIRELSKMDNENIRLVLNKVILSMNTKTIY